MFELYTLHGLYRRLREQELSIMHRPSDMAEFEWQDETAVFLLIGATFFSGAAD